MTDFCYRRWKLHHRGPVSVIHSDNFGDKKTSFSDVYLAVRRQVMKLSQKKWEIPIKYRTVPWMNMLAPPSDRNIQTGSKLQWRHPLANQFSIRPRLQLTRIVDKVSTMPLYRLILSICLLDWAAGQIVYYGKCPDLKPVDNFDLQKVFFHF